MSKKLQLTIPKPCHENWEAMTDVQRGKFCGSCQKQVVDFTNMSDRQLAEFFKKPSTGSVCGRFMNDQLEREIEIPKKRIPWLKYFFTIALPAFFISKASAQSPLKMGKVTRPALRDTTKTITVPPVRMLGMVAPLIQPVVKGDTVVMEEVIVTTPIKIRACGTEGNSITLGIPSVKGLPFLSGKVSGPVIATTTESSKVDISKTRDLSKSAGVNLQDHLVGTVGMVMVSHHSNKKEIVIDTIPAKIEIQQAAMKIFPNPVASGGSINLELKDIAEGYYSYELFTLSGQQIQQKEIWIDAEAKVLNIGLPSLAACNYFISLVNRKSRQKFTEKIIVQ
jgi:hypothetical protein